MSSRTSPSTTSSALAGVGTPTPVGCLHFPDLGTPDCRRTHPSAGQGSDGLWTTPRQSHPLGCHPRPAAVTPWRDARDAAHTGGRRAAGGGAAGAATTERDGLGGGGSQVAVVPERPVIGPS